MGFDTVKHQLKQSLGASNHDLTNGKVDHLTAEASNSVPVNRPKKRIAVIGSGVSGLSAAWLLSKAHDVVVFERDHRLGGHANTVDVPVTYADGRQETVGVDAGFIVFNRKNYPNLTALLSHLNVAVEDTCMSFGASLDNGRIEYSGQDLSALFSNRRSILSPTHWAMLRDIPRFHRHARLALEIGNYGEMGGDATMGDFVRTHGYSQSFVQHFLQPFAAAIWSTPSTRVMDYAAASLLKFFDNHGLLQILNMPLWNTVSGGSRSYVSAIKRELADNAIRLNAPVKSVARLERGVVVHLADGIEQQFDDVVLATHADDALRLLEAPTSEEKRILGAFGYQPNKALVHTDPRAMPVRRRAWSSWNYMGGGKDVAVSYWMNRLQNFTCDTDIFVTLNPHQDLEDKHIVAEFDYTHPTFNLAAARAQEEIWSLQGEGGVWFCGAHFGQGFHEDGLQAGLAVAEALGGVRRPWEVDNESGRIFLRDEGGRVNGEIEAA
ncbi:MAG: FAD-dependent oxidoreductase [Pseudomonadota bacterium]